MADVNFEDSIISQSANSLIPNNEENLIQGSSADLIGEEIKANHLHNKTDDEKNIKNDEEKDLKSAEETIKEKEEWVDILGSGQLKKKVLKAGQPDSRPQRSDVCKIKLEGRLENGAIIEKNDSLTIHVGDAEVIQGLDFVIPLMDVGEEAEAIVGPRFGYGSRGREPDIPPDATLYYSITLISAEAEPEISALSISDRKEIGNRKKERGNWWYLREENTLAIQCYRRALDYLDDIENSPDNVEENKLNEAEIHNLLEERIKVYNNLAAAQMKIKAFDTALQSVDNVLRCQPNNVKALFRKGKILGEKGDVEQSIAILRQALAVDPNSDATKKELERMSSLHKKHSKQERNLYKKMLGTNDIKDTEKKTQNSFQALTWGLLVGSIAAVVVGGAVAFRYKFL
ncbi:peptidyl-prolyl cis-trans isomerase zonda isoform X1 [Lycorma delicatula]|uniref:peptidyl-prolyl cis-trans isomerase zonda isoform X1 n=1 Tax=Lycorma delicatula TaxID=130591 RepID=UPI003F50DE33